ncbi:hypothetical protein [Myroides odoratimimus]|uniref:hypothetical protein n=1 Tax=Myroides odoratimimus TaxID=76832 RepID=UPI0025780F69|nr:hypothetical protein [Myroides odoratimimus]MDM1444010.1 hypothetical protein [Myroides odoratimimus]
MDKENFILYSVPNTDKVSGGSRTRIRNVIEVLKTEFRSFIIHGSSFKKLLKSIKAPRSSILYVESATNRLKVIDVINLLILKRKSDVVYVYIRDIYVELFPEEYNTLRKKITALFNKLSYYFYALFSDVLCFPTEEMAKGFYQYHPKFPRRKIFLFPPGTFDIRINRKNENQELNEIKISFLYLGGTKYNNSGFKDYLEVANQLGDEFTFYVISNDMLDLETFSCKNVVYLHDLKHFEVINFIKEKKITFAIHTRPRNKYDDLTFPIKFLDFISCNLPIITLEHLPLKTMLPSNYPFFVKKIGIDEILNIVKSIKQDSKLYYNVKEELCAISFNLRYESKFNEILRCSTIEDI